MGWLLFAIGILGLVIAEQEIDEHKKITRSTWLGILIFLLAGGGMVASLNV